jgi:hypothetical protein
MPRECALCHKPDRPAINEGATCNCGRQGDCLGHNVNCVAIEHFVKLDIKHHDGLLTQKLKAKGWCERGPFQNKPAIERFLCRDCIIQQDEATEMEAYRRKIMADPEPLTYYQILCT